MMNLNGYEVWLRKLDETLAAVGGYNHAALDGIDTFKLYTEGLDAKLAAVLAVGEADAHTIH